MNLPHGIIFTILKHLIVKGKATGKCNYRGEQIVVDELSGLKNHMKRYNKSPFKVTLNNFFTKEDDENHF